MLKVQAIRDEYHSSLDAHIGSRVRACRVMQGLSQRELARALGITYPQLQKYERGANRIAGARFLDLARVLNVPVAYFFAEAPSEGANGLEPPETAAERLAMRRESVDLLRAYYAISGEGRRRCVRDLVGLMARPSQDIRKATEPPAIHGIKASPESTASEAVPSLERHIREAEDRIRRQELRIARVQQRGLDTEHGEILLQCLKESLRILYWVRTTMREARRGAHHGAVAGSSSAEPTITDGGGPDPD